MKPMLASPADLKKLTYPVVISAKLDGIRCLIAENGPVSRSLKPIRNKLITAALSNPSFLGLDGELVVYRPDGKIAPFNTITSFVMSEDGELTPGQRWEFIVFDNFTRSKGFLDAFGDLCEMAVPDPDDLGGLYINNNIRILKQLHIFSEEELLTFHKHHSEEYEGTMIRYPDSPYKFGRSTVKEGSLLKLKNFHDGEFPIVGFEYLYHNENAPTINNLGLTERSSHKGGKQIDRGSIGSITIDLGDGLTCKVGSGFTYHIRTELASMGDKLIGKMAKVVYQEKTPDGALRFPVFHGLRHEDDL